jgi:hypothetical protein
MDKEVLFLSLLCIVVDNVGVKEIEALASWFFPAPIR